MQLSALLASSVADMASQAETAGESDSVYSLLVLMSLMAHVAGWVEFVQLQRKDGFPIPLILYCHLLPMIVFVYVGLAVSGNEGGISYTPLWVAAIPFPFVFLGRVLSLLQRKNGTPAEAPSGGS